MRNASAYVIDRVTKAGHMLPFCVVGNIGVTNEAFKTHLGKWNANFQMDVITLEFS